MKIGRIALALAIAALFATVAAAQTGGISVAVTDAEGNPLPGATVTISHETNFVAETADMTNKKGFVDFPVLRPGAGYTIEVSFPGFSPIRQSSLRVSINNILRVPVQMIEEIQERVKVTATRDVIDLESTASSSRFSDDFIQDLPVPGRYYQNVLTMAPGVQDADGDGNPNVHGSRSRDFSAMVGGVRNVDPLTGQWMSQINPNSIEEVEIITAGAGVEYGRAQGGFANIIQKQGSNEHEGVFDFLFQSSKLDGDGARGSESELPDNDFETVAPGFQLSGPLVRDKLWYRFSHEFRSQEDPINTGASGVVLEETTSGTHSDQVTWQVSPRNKLAFSFQSDPLEITNFGVSSFVLPEASQTREWQTDIVTLKWTAPFSPKILIDSLVSWQDQNFEIRPTQVGTANSCISEGPEVLLNARCFDAEAGRVTGSFPATWDDHRQRLTVDGKATLFGGRALGMSHQFKFGLSVENERYFRDLAQTPDMTFFIVNAAEENPDANAQNDPEPIGIALVNVFTPVSDDVRATGTNFGFFVKDTMKPAQNLTITLGARVDTEEINSEGVAGFDPIAEFQGLGPGDTAWQQAFTGFEGHADFVAQMQDILCQGAEDAGNCRTQVTEQSFARRANDLDNVRRKQNINLSNTNFSPEVSLKWSPWSNGKTAFEAAYGRHYNNIALLVPLQELQPAQSTLQYEIDLTNLSAEIDSRISPTVTVLTVDRDLKTPYQDEFLFGIERQLWAETRLSVQYIQRKYKDQLQDRNININVGDEGRCQVHRPPFNNPVAGSPGSGFMIEDPYTGTFYEDTDPGVGDGRIDDCAGEVIAIPNDTTPGGSGDSRADFLDKHVPDGIADLYVQNPFWGDIYQIGNFNAADYDAIVVEVVRGQYRGWEMNASYTWSESKGDGEDFNNFFDDDPSLEDNLVGFQSNDQRHVVKLNATTITPWGIRLGTSTTWQSGLPYSIVFRERSLDVVPLATDDLTGTSLRTRQRYPSGVRNDERNQSWWNVDLRATKEFNLGRNLNLQMSAEIYNLFDHGVLQVYNAREERGIQVNGRNETRSLFGREWQIQAKLSF